MFNAVDSKGTTCHMHKYLHMSPHKSLSLCLAILDAFALRGPAFFTLCIIPELVASCTLLQPILNKSQMLA